MRKVEDIFNEFGRFVSVEKLTDYDRRIMYDAVIQGAAVKIRNGVYAQFEALADTMVDIDKIVPGGILCLWSAWFVYGLTTQIPNAFYVAIDNKRKVTLPAYPEFQIVYQSSKLLSIGVTEKDVNGYWMKIYDIERSVCDAIKYRNKIGIDVMAEIVQSYLKSDKRNISKLMHYASQLRIANTLRQYLELWQ